ncbi:helicase conserved C-terminal domain protein [Mycobacterium xenopi 4042]|uniref:Helicase conserved C-terminal domain protein n=1 Tax=Mycobacterium xenopi 4042 TaxID=1299334 RepID=X8AGF1_MYCXE|nr:helicase conserved C-terminal domain protein [Mycobacterium xenopi 4042]
MIQGSTKTAEREALFDAFRRGEVTTLVVSKVANFAIDLPEAAVAVQVSGTFGSRQEEAQRLGRLLRPRQAAAAPSSTRWWPATAKTPNTPPTGSGSWPSRATAMSSATPTTCWARQSSLRGQDRRGGGTRRSVHLRKADPRCAAHLTVPASPRS